MKKFLVFIYILVVIVFLKLVITFSINEVVIYKYEKEDYDKNLVKSLFVLNFNEKYIAHYNYGNILYKIGYYEDAIKEYNKALDNNPEEERVCSVRINLAMATINTINEEMECEEKYEIYENALDILYEDSCAGEGEDVGSNETADKLEEEIQALYDEEKATCEAQSGGGGEGEDDEKDKGDDESEEKSEEEKKSDEVEERNKDAQQNRQDELEKMEDYDNYSGSYYKGKRW